MSVLEEHHVRLAETKGANLSGRMRAINLREALETELDRDGVVILDFEGVEGMSPSFADELFVRFVDKVGEDRVKFENMSEQLVGIAAVVQRRRRPAV